MKFFVFDDTVLLSGANLGESYFTNRADRYIVISNCPKLASYYEALYFAAKYINQFKTEEDLPVDRLHSLFHRPDKVSETSTVLYPSTSSLWSAPETKLSIPFAKNSIKTATLLSAYLNLPEPVISSLKSDLNLDNLTIVSASEESNGFAGAAGILVIIPKLYRCLQAETSRALGNKPKLLEYTRPGCTFHGKGVILKTSTELALLFGSSNYGILTIFFRIF